MVWGIDRRVPLFDLDASPPPPPPAPPHRGRAVWTAVPWDWRPKGAERRGGAFSTAPPVRPRPCPPPPRGPSTHPLCLRTLRCKEDEILQIQRTAAELKTLYLKAQCDADDLYNENLRLRQRVCGGASPLGPVPRSPGGGGGRGRGGLSGGLGPGGGGGCLMGHGFGMARDGPSRPGAAPRG